MRLNGPVQDRCDGFSSEVLRVSSELVAAIKLLSKANGSVVLEFEYFYRHHYQLTVCFPYYLSVFFRLFRPLPVFSFEERRCHYTVICYYHWFSLISISLVIFTSILLPPLEAATVTVIILIILVPLLSGYFHQSMPLTISQLGLRLSLDIL